MRRFALLLCALLLALVASGPNLLHAKPVHAATTACEVAGDVEDVVYTDWHASGGQIVQDSYPYGPSWHMVGIDLWSWRISHNPSGTGLDHCYRAMYASAATNDGTPGYFTAHFSTWVCGTWGYAWTRNTAWASRTDAYTADNFWGPPGTSDLIESVTLPSGVTYGLWFADYGPFPIENGCLPQAWTDGMEASSGTWTPTVLHSSPGVQWFCADRNDPVSGRNFYCP